MSCKIMGGAPLLECATMTGIAVGVAAFTLYGCGPNVVVGIIAGTAYAAAAGVDKITQIFQERALIPWQSSKSIEQLKVSTEKHLHLSGIWFLSAVPIVGPFAAVMKC